MLKNFRSNNPYHVNINSVYAYLHFITPSFLLSLSLSFRHIANCSHWVQQDAPEEVNQFMREFLQEWRQKILMFGL